MNKARQLLDDIQIAKERNPMFDIDPFTDREDELSLIDKIRFKYYVQRQFSKNIFQALWNMFWW